MKRVLGPAAVLAFAAAAAGCQPPVEKSEYNNSGFSVAVAENPSLAKPPVNPAPRIEPAADASASAQPTPSPQEIGGKG